MTSKLICVLFTMLALASWGCNGGDKSPTVGNEAYAGPPYTLRLEEFVNPDLPALHAYIQGVYQDKIVMMGGRINGLHGSYDFQDNYNDTIFVINTNNWASPKTWTVKKLGVDSDLLKGGPDKEQLEANNAQFFTKDSVLYIVGGLIGDTIVKSNPRPTHCSPYITAITLPALINTVNNGVALQSGSIRQAKDDQLAVTGGELELMDNTVKLVFGWDFYKGSDGKHVDGYSHQVRSFTYTDDGKKLTISPVTVCPTCWDGHIGEDTLGYFRRRDGSMSAMIDPSNGEEALMYYAGVFKNGDTNFDNPVWIGADDAKEVDFVMRSNIYTCRVLPVYSPSRMQSYATLMGGMKNAIYTGTSSGLPVLLDSANAKITSVPDDFSSIPFSNQFSTMMIDKNHQYSQYLLSDSFPATQVEYAFKDTTALPAGSVAYNGTGSELIWTLSGEDGRMPHGVVNYDAFIKAYPQGGVIGYLHGGILSRVENAFDKNRGKLTRASNRIFAVKLVPLQQ